MKNLVIIFAALLGVTFLFTSCEQSINAPLTSTNDLTKSYIVLYEDSGDKLQSINFDSKLSEILSVHKIDRSSVTYIYDHIFTGFAANLSEAQVSSLKSDKRIIEIEEDQIFNIQDLTNEDENNPDTQAQSTPWGITAVGGSVDATSSTGIAWVVDTGIDLTHSDLNVNTTLSKTFVTSGQDALSANDLHSHGSHVAGTIAAKNNNAGVVGVCAGAELVAIKVFDYTGKGSSSTIIAGLNYISANLVSGRINVVNMSLGGSASTTLDNAVKALAAKGVYMVVAAGNSAKSATLYSPARVEATNVFTISAHDSKGVFATFSNFNNPPVDFAAPGVSIYSTSKSGGYATKSGTSMATPHVAGIILANNGTVNWSGNVTKDIDSTPDKKARR